MTGSEITPEDSRETAYAGILSFMRFPYSRDLTTADIAVLGVPYDLGTTNRSGARSGPRAIREQSALYYPILLLCLSYLVCTLYKAKGLLPKQKPKLF